MLESRRRDIRRKAEAFKENCKTNIYGIINLFEECTRKGYKLIRYPLGEQGVLGFALKRDGDYIIFTNSSIRLSRETFTLAHEIGHIVLHFEKYSSFIDDNRTLYVLCSDEKEQEANYFAACLLMPEDRVRKFYDIELNNIDPSELSAYDIAKMMSEFSSSFEMVLNRLDDIKLIDAVQKTRLNSEKNEMRVGNLLRVIGGNCRLNEVSNIIRLPYEYLDYVIYNYNHNAIPIETLEKVLEAYQLTIEDISDKLITPKEEEDSDLDELIGGIEE